MENDEMLAEKLIGEFNHSKNPDVDRIKTAAKELCVAILEIEGSHRRKEIALTHVEQAAMMAVKAIFAED